MIAAVMAFSNLLLTQQTYSAERDGAHAHNPDLVPLTITTVSQFQIQHMRVWEGALPYVAHRGMCHLTGFYFKTFLPSTGYIILGKSVLNRV